ncbi:hypothetical protein TraAM80_09515, partial [Trypanosoma rangeli]
AHHRTKGGAERSHCGALAGGLGGGGGTFPYAAMKRPCGAKRGPKKGSEEAFRDNPLPAKGGPPPFCERRQTEGARAVGRSGEKPAGGGHPARGSPSLPGGDGWINERQDHGSWAACEWKGQENAGA